MQLFMMLSLLLIENLFSFKFFLILTLFFLLFYFLFLSLHFFPLITKAADLPRQWHGFQSLFQVSF